MASEGRGHRQRRASERGMRPAGFGPDDRRILLARISLDVLRLIGQHR